MRGLASAAERLLTTKSLCHFVNKHHTRTPGLLCEPEAGHRFCWLESLFFEPVCSWKFQNLPEAWPPRWHSSQGLARKAD